MRDSIVDSVLFSYIFFVLLPTTHCIYYCSFIISHEIRSCWTFELLLLYQICFGYSIFLIFYVFINSLTVTLKKKNCLDCVWHCTDQFGKTDIKPVSVNSESRSVMSDSFWPHGLYSPWNSPGQNIGVGSLSLLQGISPAQGSNPGLSALQANSLPAEPQYTALKSMNKSVSLMISDFSNFY